MKEKDIKLLWGRAASRCAFCKTELSQDKSSSNSSFVIGEHAHIVGETSGSPRGNSSLTAEERDTYHNHVLLCPNHHTEVDKNEADWPVEKLYMLKSEHELWVRENLSESIDLRRTADQLAVSSLVDDVVDTCSLHDWNDWVARAYGRDARLGVGTLKDPYGFRVRIASVIVSADYEELHRAASTIAILLLKFHDTFMEHVEERHGDYKAVKFYKQKGEWNPNYDRDLERYELWTSEYSNLLLRATKAANWFADLVRRDINPSFFIEQGKFRLFMGMGTDFNYYTTVPEYTDEERKALPEGL
jgi:hypothetical protein